MNHNPYQQYPIDQQLKIEVVQLKREMFELQTKLMECNEQNFNLQATILTIETEAKFEAGQEAQKLQSELTFKNRELDEQNRELKKLMKELQELKQQNKPSNDSKSLSQSNSQFLTHIKTMPLATSSSSSSSIPSVAPTIEPIRRSIKPFEPQPSDGNLLIQSLYQIFLDIVIFLSATDMKINPDNPATGRLTSNMFSTSKNSLGNPPPSSTHIKSILKKTTDKLITCPNALQPILVSIDQMLSSISSKLPLNEFKTSLPLVQLTVQLSMSLSNMLFSSNSLDQDCYNPHIQSYIQAFELSLQFIQLSISLYHFSQTKLQLQQQTNLPNPLFSSKFLEITSEKHSKNINLMVQFDNIQTSKPAPPSKSSSSSTSSSTTSSSSRSTLSDSIQSIQPTSSKSNNKPTDLLTKFVQFPSGIQPSLSKLFPLPNDPTNPHNKNNNNKIQLFPMDLFELGLDFLYLCLEKLDLLLLYLENIPIITKQSLLQQLINYFSMWVQQYPLDQTEEHIQQQIITMICWLFEYSQHLSSCKQQLLIVLFDLLQDRNCYKYFLYDQLSFSEEIIKLLTNNTSNTTNDEPHHSHNNKDKPNNNSSDNNKPKHSSFSLLVILLQDLRQHSTDLSSDLFSYQAQIINFIFDLLHTKKHGFLPYLLSISRDMIWKSSSNQLNPPKATTSTSPPTHKPPNKKRKHTDIEVVDVNLPPKQPQQPQQQPQQEEVSFRPISNDHLLYDITTQEFPIQAYHREFYKIYILFWTFLWKLLDTLPIFPECYTSYHKQLVMMTKKATLTINMFLELLTPSLRKELTRDVYNDIEVFFYRNYLSSFPMTFKLTEPMTKEIEKLIDNQEP